MSEREAEYVTEAGQPALERRECIRNLLKGGAYTKEQLAQRLCVSERTIYDDLVWLMTTRPRAPIIMEVEQLRFCRFTMMPEPDS